MDFTSLDLHGLHAERNAREQLLKNSDYKALKAFEGHPSSDWPAVQGQREQWRKDINAIDGRIVMMETAD